MKIYICTDHDIHYVNGAAVVIAHNEDEARKLLDEALQKAGLKPYAEKPYTLTKISQARPQAVILQDGNY